MSALTAEQLAKDLQRWAHGQQRRQRALEARIVDLERLVAALTARLVDAEGAVADLQRDGGAR